MTRSLLALGAALTLAAATFSTTAPAKAGGLGIGKAPHLGGGLGYKPNGFKPQGLGGFKPAGGLGYKPIHLGGPAKIPGGFGKGSGASYPGKPHHHGWGGGAMAAGVMGGLALGAIAASAAPAYVDDGCYTVRRRYVDAYGDLVIRRVRICE